MSSRRIKFVWGSSDRIKGRWFLGLTGTYERSSGSRGRAISVRGALAWLGAVAVVGYVAAASALFLWFDRRPDNLIRYTDTILLPLRREQVRELRGRMMIAEGLEDLAAQRWTEAAMKLRVGLARDPHNVAGRLALARFYLMANRRPNAIEVLTAGLAHGYLGREYLAVLFETASAGEDHELVIATCERFLPSATADREWLQHHRLQALIEAGRADVALQAAREEGDGGGARTKELQVLALLALGRTSEALEFLDRWAAAAPAEVRVQILRLRVRALREARRLSDMRLAWDELRQLTPSDPRPYVYGVVQTALAGETAAAADALETFFLRFAGRPANLAMAANALAEAKQPRLVRRCVERAEQQGFPLRSLGLVLLQSQVLAGEWPEALRTVEQVRPTLADATPIETFAFTWLDRLVATVARHDDGAQAALIDLFQQQPLPRRIFEDTAEVLVRDGRYATARTVAEIGARAYPTSRSLAAMRERADAGLRAAAVATAVPLAAAAAMGRADEFFREIEQLAAGARWSELAQSVRTARVAKPEWLPAHEARVLEWQMRAAIGTGDALELLGAAKLYVDGTPRRSLHVLALARELGQQGQRDTASRLLNEVLRKNAAFPPALRLKKEWQAAAAEQAASAPAQ